MNQKTKHTEPTTNSYAAAYGYKYVGSLASHTVTKLKHSSSWITNGSGNTLFFEDMYHRIRDENHPNGKYVITTITLVRLMNNGKIVSIISFTWGLYINPDGTGGAYLLNKTDKVSSFHHEAIMLSLPEGTYKH